MGRRPRRVKYVFLPFLVSAMRPSSFAVPGKAPVSRLVFGTLRLHEAERPYALLDEAWRLGIRAFDTARVYGAGECEKILGEWLRGATNDYGNGVFYDHDAAVLRRREATVVTKGGCGDGSTFWRPDLAKGSLRRELEMSVRALGGTVDVYVLHRDERERDVGEICRTMQAFIDAELINAWGVSNWHVDRIEEAIHYARSRGLAPPRCSSLQDSLARPSQEPWPGTVYMDDRQRKWYARHKHDIAVLGWETLGKGFLAGRWNEDDLLAGDGDLLLRDRDRSRDDDLVLDDSSSVDVYSDSWREMRLKTAYLTEDNFRRRDRAALFARAKGDFRPEHVAIAWCLAQDYEAHVITATVNPDHLRSNVRALALHLSAQDVHWLTSGSTPDNLDLLAKATAAAEQKKSSSSVLERVAR